MSIAAKCTCGKNAYFCSGDECGNLIPITMDEQKTPEAQKCDNQFCWAFSCGENCHHLQTSNNVVEASVKIKNDALHALNKAQARIAELEQKNSQYEHALKNIIALNNSNEVNWADVGGDAFAIAFNTVSLVDGKEVAFAAMNHKENG